MRELLTDVLRSFGGYLGRHPGARVFPEPLVAAERARLHLYWQQNFERQLTSWRAPGLTGVFFGTIVGSDLAVYVARFGLSFDRLLLREPLSKILLLEQAKTPEGLFEEIVAYLNLLLALEPLIEADVVSLYPPFYLMAEPLHIEVVEAVDRRCRDEPFRGMAMSCPDRGLGERALAERYRGIFAEVFRPDFVDLFGGWRSFTEDYIVRTMAQDVATADVLARAIGAVPVTCLARHQALYEYDWAEGASTARLELPRCEGTYSLLARRREGDFVHLRRCLAEVTLRDAQPSDLVEALAEVRRSRPRVGVETVCLRRAPGMGSRCLKAAYVAAGAGPAGERQHGCVSDGLCG